MTSKEENTARLQHSSKRAFLFNRGETANEESTSGSPERTKQVGEKDQLANGRRRHRKPGNFADCCRVRSNPGINRLAGQRFAGSTPAPAVDRAASRGSRQPRRSTKEKPSDSVRT